MAGQPVGGGQSLEASFPDQADRPQSSGSAHRRVDGHVPTVVPTSAASPCGESLDRSKRWHLRPLTSVKQAAVGLWGTSAPLLEEEGHASSEAAVTQAADPLFLDGAASVS